MSQRDPRASMVTERELAVLDAEPGQFLFGAHHNVAVCVWAAQASSLMVARLGHVASSICRAHPEGVSMVHVVLSGAGVPDADARSALIALASTRSERVVSIAVAVLGTGFWASAVRSFITGVHIACPRSFELAIHPSIAEAAAWLPSGHGQRTGVFLSTTGLSAMVGQACTLLHGASGGHGLVPRKR